MDHKNEFIVQIVKDSEVFNCISDRRKLSQHSDALPPESITFINEDSETLVKETNISFEKAKHYLEEKTRVVVTGVQGTGKTYLAESLVLYMNKKRRKLKKMWISSFSQLLEEKSKPTRNVDLYILDGLFYELLLETEFQKILRVLYDFMNNFPEICIIITMPSYLWKKDMDPFSKSGLENVHIDLNKRDNSEKLYIMKQFMSQHYIIQKTHDSFIVHHKFYWEKLLLKPLAFQQ